MDLKAVLAVFFYYVIMASLFHFGVSSLQGATLSGGSLDTTYTEAPGGTNTTGISGFFSRVGNTLDSIGEMVAFMFFGLGLPDDTPEFFQYGFSVVASLITLVSAIVVKNAIWGGGGTK
jgi:hypothetical protein